MPVPEWTPSVLLPDDSPACCCGWLDDSWKGRAAGTPCRLGCAAVCDGVACWLAADEGGPGGLSAAACCTARRLEAGAWGEYGGLVEPCATEKPGLGSTAECREDLKGSSKSSGRSESSRSASSEAPVRAAQDAVLAWCSSETVQ